MLWVRGLAASAFLFAAASSASPHETASSDFDFYVLALSWSPSYCQVEGEDANRLQCGGDSNYGFIVHGLWPQFERGYPEFCETPYAERIPYEMGEPFFDIMPGMGLIGHQWRKHGSCTGLEPQNYLDLTRSALERIEMPAKLQSVTGDMEVDPAAVEDAFIAANPRLQSGGIAVTCDRENLREVRICLTRDLAFRTCEEIDDYGCRRSRVALPARPSFRD